MLDLLFVYGTLRSEFDNRYARLLRKEATFLRRASIPGSIYRVEHYPAFRPHPEGAVQGELYRLHTPEVTLAVLDEYEGEEFLSRATAPILRAGGAPSRSDGSVPCKNLEQFGV